MRISVLGSGSSGNCTYFETNKLKCLIDLGTTCLYTTTKLKQLSINPYDITSIFITHDHDDHIAGLKVFLKKYQPTVYLTNKLYESLKNIGIEKYHIIDEELVIEDLKITTIKTSHDASDSIGFIFENGNKGLVYVTDTGYINKKYHELLKNKDVYILESNHDVKMLMEGNYPYHLKQRILGDYGHLSNESCHKYLQKFISTNTKYIFLAHISEHNNTKDLVLSTNESILEEHQCIKLIVTDQHTNTELVEI